MTRAKLIEDVPVLRYSPPPYKVAVIIFQVQTGAGAGRVGLKAV